MRRTALAVVLVLGVLATCGAARAATLEISGSISTVDVVGRCTAAPVPVTDGATSGATAQSVVLTVPAGCHGLPGVLRLVGVPGAADVAFTLPPAGTATATVPVPGGFPAGAVTRVAMTLGTWGVRTTWTRTAPPSQPPVDPSAYTSVGSAGTGSRWTGNTACVHLTVTGNGTSAAPFSWVADVDLAAAFERVSQGGGTLAVSSDLTAGMGTLTHVAGTTYRVTSGPQGALSGRQSRTVELCVLRS